ncbi:hypothetical protein ABMA27_016317 [Loxostege sticticalis]|uniref:CCHC-type domain-containing protein n=1 Tax=Loxostege sticticalis TaxID=481309 RepID=A0ABR3I1U0_LOXSC
MSDSPDPAQMPSSEVGREGLNPPEETVHENVPQSSKSVEKDRAHLFTEMESIFTRLIAATQTVSVPNNSTQLIKFDPDDAESDIEGWCKITDIIVSSRKLAGPELLLALIHALKGRAATCLTKLGTSEIEWPPIKEILLFQIGNTETASQAALRLWNLIECIPKVEMEEDVIAGFVISVLCQRDALIRRELNSHTVTTRAQLCRILGGISLKRRNEDTEGHDINAKRTRLAFDSRFNGSCHYCGNRGHKIEECRKRQNNIVKPQVKERENIVTCFTCGNPGHLMNHQAKKEVHVCDRKLARSTLSTSTGQAISWACVIFPQIHS